MLAMLSAACLQKSMLCNKRRSKREKMAKPGCSMLHPKRKIQKQRIYKMRREMVTPDQKLQAVKEVLERKSSLRQVARQYGLHHSSVEKWVTLYQTFGAEAFYRTHNSHYSEEVKQKAVKKYLTTGASLQDICREFQLRSISQVQKWVEDEGKQKNCRPDRLIS